MNLFNLSQKRKIDAQFDREIGRFWPGQLQEKPDEFTDELVDELIGIIFKGKKFRWLRILLSIGRIIGKIVLIAIARKRADVGQVNARIKGRS